MLSSIVLWLMFFASVAPALLGLGNVIGPIAAFLVFSLIVSVASFINFAFPHIDNQNKQHQLLKELARELADLKRNVKCDYHEQCKENSENSEDENEKNMHENEKNEDEQESESEDDDRDSEESDSDKSCSDNETNPRPENEHASVEKDQKRLFDSEEYFDKYLSHTLNSLGE